MHLSSDEENKIIIKYDKLVKKIAHKFCAAYGCYQYFDDLCVEGQWGLLKAIRWYDTAKNVPFEKTAALLIKTYINVFYKKNIKNNILTNSVCLDDLIL